MAEKEEEMIADMMKPEFRDYIRDLSSDKYGFDRDKKSPKQQESDTKFVSCLDEASLKKVNDELNERNDKDRVMAVQTLRQWIKDVKYVRTPTDISFLLRFLRVTKFSQPDAQKQLEHYWAAKTKRPDWYRNIDPADPDLQKVFKSGLMCLPKNRDKHNRRVYIANMSKISADLIKEVGMATIYKTFACVHEWLATDEHVQVNGIVVIPDYSNVTMEWATPIYKADDFNDFVSYFQNGLPARVKSMNVYNEPPFFDFIFSLFSPFLSQKLRSRYHFHGQSLMKIYDDVGYECLPDKYLPDDLKGTGAGPINNCIEEMVADMMKPEFRDYIRDLSSDKYGVDKEKQL